MITSIQGLLTAATPLHAIIELNGLGYEVNIPVTTAEKLPQTGSTVKLHTLVIYREDAQTLYGFATPAERDFFRLMIEHVTGVGPKMALTIMSKLSLPLLQSTIANGDVATLSKCPGIGKKTAERLVIELRSKVGVTGSAESVLSASGISSEDSAAPADNKMRDAILALNALGYKTADADEAIRRAILAIGPKATTEQLIKKALGS
ncbi:Holliday junction branch migration protein RuvA [Rariglobus hedericola]|uniref:Holliday junction branch migration complex subunit RuvA n=1 Tax=Rariglobus hedericola TaxID=2597822 RepID=A0A556QNP3_9BACT|nr:Holliday junction branch migration protein RuvA [Rariglobus hedericola]TSJ78266.1 Holliday junction branch migration protein RuvA [Rariglobus hedericola]